MRGPGIYAIYQALRAPGQPQENGRRCTYFMDLHGRRRKVRIDTVGPGQRFAIATMEVCTRALARDKVTMADEYARATAEGITSWDDAPDEYRCGGMPASPT